MRYYRKKKGLTQADLAYLTDIHRTYIGGIEQCKRNPSFEILVKIAHAFAISLADLFDESVQAKNRPR